MANITLSKKENRSLDKAWCDELETQRCKVGLEYVKTLFAPNHLSMHMHHL